MNQSSDYINVDSASGGELGLDDWVIEDLAKSGLKPDTFTVEPLRSEVELKAHLGFTHIGGILIMDVGGYWIPYLNVPGYYRLKLREKLGDVKYLSPKDSGNHAYILPEVAEIAKNYNPDKPIFITEGEKKAGKATLEGFPTIGLSGVWNFKDSENDFLNELTELNLKNRKCYICFDSDISHKFHVHLAELRLAVAIINRGGIPLSVRLPINQIDKAGLDDVLVEPNGREKFQELLANAKPTIELQLEEDTPTELLVNEVSKVQSEIEKDKWLRLISEECGISYRAVCKDAKRYKPVEESELLEKKYTAYFPGLIDLVEDKAGNVAFLVKENGELTIKPSMVIDGEVFYAPIREQLPFKFLPHAVGVLKQYTHDTDRKLFTDLIEYLKLVSELPNDKLYELIAAWILHTYLLEAFEYSPYIWLYAIPERGKSRTGKGAIYVAYRGVHVESLRDPYLLRISSNLKATIFFDAMDIWGKAEKAGSEDFLLQRYERGALVARVLYPERGPYEDTKYFNIFGATLVATNEPVHAALESRAVLISMKEASKEFGDIPLELARSLKERLVAFRARHLGRELPRIDKPAKGRLGDILKPLMQIILLVNPEREAGFRQLISELDQDRKAQKSDSTDAKLVSIIAELEDQVNDGLLSIQAILNLYNEGVDGKYKTTSQRLGWRLKALGFTKRRQEKGTHIEFDPELLERLRVKFGLNEGNTLTDTPSEKLQDLQDLHSSNKDNGFRDVDFAADSQENQTSTGNLHEENPHKYRTNVNPVDAANVSNGTKEKITRGSWEEEKDRFLREVEEA